jgi:hypothetical protein
VNHAETDITIVEKSPFTQEELLKTWQHFTNSVEKDMPRIYQMLKANEPLLEDNFTIKLMLENQSQEKVLMERAHAKLMVHLKTTLKNGAIKLIIELGKNQSANNIVYTATDRFKYLADINDKLNILKQKFDLDFE